MTQREEEREKNCVAIMDLKEVGELIHRKDKECIKKWLHFNKITIHRLGNLTFVYQIDFDCAMILPHVKDFKRKHPLQWEAYYQKTIKDETLFNLIMLSLEVEINYKPATKVKRRSQGDEKLYQKLLG